MASGSGTRFTPCLCRSRPELRKRGRQFMTNIEIGNIALSFYMNYFIVSLLLLVLAFVVVRRLERSWIGLNLDALRLDETAA